jgi:hypothetical protein
MITRQLQTGEVARYTPTQRFVHLQLRVNSLRSFAIVVVASVTLSFALFILATRSGAILSGQAASPSQPFAVYDSILPGRPSAALDGFRCQQAFDRNSTPPCSILPEGGLFHLINVTTRQGKITEVNFFSESLQLGDLLHQWGEPDSMNRSGNARATTLVWNTGTHQFLATLPLFGTHPHVRVVTMRLNCESTNSGVCSQPS